MYFFLAHHISPRWPVILVMSFIFAEVGKPWLENWILLVNDSFYYLFTLKWWKGERKLLVIYVLLMAYDNDNDGLFDLIVHIWEYKGYPGHRNTLQRLAQDPVRFKKNILEREREGAWTKWNVYMKWTNNVIASSWKRSTTPSWSNSDLFLFPVRTMWCLNFPFGRPLLLWKLMVSMNYVTIN